MQNMANSFSREVEFPYPKPEINERSSGKNYLLLQRPTVEDCACLDHGQTPEMSYMHYIRAKDTQQYLKLQAVRNTMASQASDIIQHQCHDDNTKMNAIHMVDYRKRGHIPGCFTPLKPASVSEVGTPIEPLRVGLTQGQRDPELFPLCPKPRHNVNKSHSLIFTRTPENLKHWHSTSIPGRSEYEDTVSRLGLARMRNTRQYLEPLPSSRLRSGDPNC